MADLVCGHKHGMLTLTKVVGRDVAKQVGKSEWADSKVCNDCHKGVQQQFAEILDAMPVLSVETLEGHRIESYYGFVSGQSVIGTGAVAEFISDFTDFFGGASGAFAEKIALGEQASLRMMKCKALAQGANAIVGVDLDYGELGGSKGMIMVVSTGTAVKLSKVLPTPH